MFEPHPPYSPILGGHAIPRVMRQERPVGQVRQTDHEWLLGCIATLAMQNVGFNHIQPY